MENNYIAITYHTDATGKVCESVTMGRKHVADPL